MFEDSEGFWRILWDFEWSLWIFVDFWSFWGSFVDFRWFSPIFEEVEGFGEIFEDGRGSARMFVDDRGRSWILVFFYMILDDFYVFVYILKVIFQRYFFSKGRAFRTREAPWLQPNLLAGGLPGGALPGLALAASIASHTRGTQKSTTHARALRAQHSRKKPKQTRGGGRRPPPPPR